MESIIDVLVRVPEVRLRLIGLVWKVVKEDGSIDPEKVAFYGKEITEALDEARDYAETAREAVQCLKNLAR